MTTTNVHIYEVGHSIGENELGVLFKYVNFAFKWFLNTSLYCIIHSISLILYDIH